MNLEIPEAIGRYVKSYNEEMKKLSASSSSVLRKIRNRCANVEGEIARAIDAIMRGILDAEDVRDRIAGLKAEKEGLQQEICRLEHSKLPVALHPTTITAYLVSVENLEDSIRTNSLHASEDSKSALRELVDAVIVRPAGD